MPSITIRPAERADLALILQFIRELAEYEKAPEQAVATAEMIERALFGETHGRRPIAECVIGLVDGVPQGFALYFMNFSTWVGKAGMYLEDLFVRPSARGAGLGKALLTHVAKVAASRGCRRFEWAVLDWNTPAIDFYKGLGAEPMSEWTTFRLAGEKLDALAR